MAKTLVALYDTVTDAERVVQELMADGFARRDIHLALDDTQGRASRPSAGEREAAYAGATLIETLTDLGVPSDEAHAYVEGVRRGGALIVVESGDDQAERGMAILQRLHPVNMPERTAQWRQAGWTRAAPTTSTGPPPPSP